MSINREQLQRHKIGIHFHTLSAFLLPRTDESPRFFHLFRIYTIAVWGLREVIRFVRSICFFLHFFEGESGKRKRWLLRNPRMWGFSPWKSTSHPLVFSRYKNVWCCYLSSSKHHCLSCSSRASVVLFYFCCFCSDIW